MRMSGDDMLAEKAHLFKCFFGHDRQAEKSITRVPGLVIANIAMENGHRNSEFSPTKYLKKVIFP